MSNLEKASRLLHDFASENGIDVDMYHAAKDLLVADLLMPDVQVIRTLEEVEALDSYALLADKDGGLYNRAGILENVTPENMGKYMPLAVLVTRGQFRAAREALEEENE